MKIAYLILAHRYPEQLRRLVLTLKRKNTSFFIHIDKNTDNNTYQKIVNQLRDVSQVYFLKRYKCYWGHFNIAKATFKGIETILDSGINFDRLFLLSGQDYPIKPVKQIEAFLEANEDKEYMEFFDLTAPNKWTDFEGCWQALIRVEYWHLRFRSKFLHIRGKRNLPNNLVPYGGSQWWCLSRECVEYIDTFIRENPSFINYFKYVLVPDEILFSTIVLNSPFKNNVINDDLRYIDWENPNPTTPAVMVRSDFDRLMRCSDLFARKFDMSRDPKILTLLDENVLNKTYNSV